MKHDQRRFAAARAYRDDTADRIRRFLPMVRRLAWHIHGSGRAGMELEDLVQAGLVERRAIAGDRRSYAMHLTPEGRRLAEAGIAIQRDFVAKTLGRLAPADLSELDRLVVLWRDLARAVDAEPDAN